MSTQKQEEEETLIYINFNTKMDSSYFCDDKPIKIIGLDEDRPILQWGNQIFQGEWRDTMGTHVFLEETTTPPTKFDPIYSEPPPIYMKYSCKTDKVLHMKRIFTTPKDCSKTPTGSEELPDNSEVPKDPVEDPLGESTNRNPMEIDPPPGCSKDPD